MRIASRSSFDVGLRPVTGFRLTTAAPLVAHKPTAGATRKWVEQTGVSVLDGPCYVLIALHYPELRE